MATFSLRDAAQQAGVGKSTILRAVQSGRLSAGRTEGGGYEIDSSELLRVYPPKSAPIAPDHVAHRSEGQDAPPAEKDSVALRMAVLEAELAGLKALIAEVRDSRDNWQAQVTRLTNALPSPSAGRSWWRRLAG